MNATTRTELEALFTSLLEQEAGPAEMGRLEELLRGDWECRRLYLEYADLHARLLQDPAIASGKLIPMKPRPRALPRWMPFAAAAAVLLSGAALFSLRAPGRAKVAATAEQTENGCAVVSQIHGEQEIASGTILKPGPLHLKGGLARIEFFCGATVLLEGEGSLEIVSAWEAVCRQGKVRVSVPPPAQGFRLRAPNMKLVDIGTEFGMTVDAAGAAEVHVFEGQVEAYPAGAAVRLVVGGQSLRQDGAALTAGLALPASFTNGPQMDALVRDRAEERFESWSQWSLQMRRDPRLVAYYAFKHWADDRWDRVVNTFTEPRDKTRTGAAVGAHWTHGRWPMKDALEFKGPADRVRLDLGQESYSAITLAAWVCVEGLDRKYNALLLTDGYDAGQPHWQVYEDGRLMFSISYPDPAKPAESKAKRNQIYFSPSIFNLANQRRWHQIAVSYDSVSGEAIQYLDGHEVSREVSPFHQPGRRITFGAAEIGNWGLPTEGHQFPIRNLNGRIDEFAIYHAALSPAEIAQFYEAGKPE